MFLTPDTQTYEELRMFAQSHESYDRGDQGLLNVFFGDGTMGHPLKRLLGRDATTFREGACHLVGDQDLRKNPVPARTGIA